MSARLSDNDLSTLDAAALRDYLRHFVDAGDTATAERILAEQERRRRPGESVGFPPCRFASPPSGKYRGCEKMRTFMATIAKCCECADRQEA